ncbi:SMC-Scp complex subunit ScpB [Thermomicrobium sp. 4228-Ro]|uniref:SMC-Scp complex subunit ScpB n=1 Tax=Thermomicrobium sp. 4228-Ro TaxID=2993937 RepID=UPI0022488A60|nr:SMC-Scp complex subunit ScpB [Thermomicrobium sp. 4228-Ro]MCX2727099.1 SMC-Scp complex subunit ScpB [Thermomicrobium sp. 4228-Ro]
MTLPDRAALLGALLFVSGEPVSRERLAAVLGVSLEELDAVVVELTQRAATLGLVLLHHDDRLQLATAPELGPVIAQFLGIPERSRLSTAALETLAIVAYLQPVTRAEIDAVRGVDSSGAIQTLLAHGLIEPVGRRASPGQPVEYGTTALFLQRFGLPDLRALPPLPGELRALLVTRREPV